MNSLPLGANSFPLREIPVLKRDVIVDTVTPFDVRIIFKRSVYAFATYAQTPMGYLDIYIHT